MLTITINADHQESVVIFPISRGPYAGIDVLYVENDWCGKHSVRRHKTDGELIEDYGKHSYDDALALVKKLQVEQSNRNCNAVTGGGRWSCE
jgi:hypothetical protein